MVGAIYAFGKAEKTTLSEEVWYEGFNKGCDTGDVHCELGMRWIGLCSGEAERRGG